MPFRPTPPLAGLRNRRHHQALSQEELGQRASLSRSTINRLEAGERSAHPATIRRLASVLRCSPADLYRVPS